MTTSEVRAAGQEANRRKGIEHARRILELHDQGLRGQALADELGVSVSSVWSLVTRARRRLGVPTSGRSRHKPQPCTYCGDIDHPGPC